MADDPQLEQPPDFRQLGRDITLGMEDTGAALRNLTYVQNLAINVVSTIL
jgi:hypothetical protein